MTRVRRTLVVALALSGAAVPWATAATDMALVREKAAPCFACHGAEGRSATPDVPSLAGQPKQFITTQLVMYREGNRKHAVMNALAGPLSNAEINDYGSYFSAQVLSSSPAARQADAAPGPGSQLAERLNCVQCHGADLKGQQHIPRLAGQQADYLRNQLTGFRAGTRFDMDGNMTAAAQALTPADIDVLAPYLNSLR